MSASIWEYTSKANPAILSEQLYRQQWRDHSFGRWVAPEFIKITRGPDVTVDNLPKPGQRRFSGAPIEVFEEFQSMGRTHIDIPVKNRLTGTPVHGDKPLEGSGERTTVNYRSVDINYTRKAARPPTGTSLQIVKEYADKIAFDMQDDLKTWMGDYHPGNFILAMLAGASRDLILPTTMGGKGYTVHSHPNLFVAGIGPVSYNSNGTRNHTPWTAAYEADVESALNSMTNTAQYFLTLKMVSALKVSAIRLKVAPIVMQGGFSFYPMFISDAQWVQLQQDPEWSDVYKRLPAKWDENPLLTGAVGYWDGVVLFVDQDMFAAHTNSESGGIVPASTPWYGPIPSSADATKGIEVGNWIPSLDTGNLKVGFIMGRSAMSVGVAVPQLKDGKFGARMSFTSESWDHGFFQEVGLSFIQSVVRSDIIDQDGQLITAGSFYENTSSVAFATYSPHQLAWN